MLNFRPFGANTGIYDFWWWQGGIPSLYAYTILGVARGRAPGLSKKMLYFAS